MPKTAREQPAALKVEVSFFGNFQVSVGNKRINDSSSRARRPWTLLQYLLVYRHKTVPRQQLIEALWPDGTSDQPEKALKNLVYRVRSAFAAHKVPCAQDVILFRGGNYQLNNELNWQLDYELFEALYVRATEAGRPNEDIIEDALRAIDLYRGDFLADQVYEDWLLPYNTYYHSIFIKLVELALTLLEQAGRDADIEQVSGRAQAVDPFEESLHLAYMNALVRQKKKNQALAHYNKMADMLYREMGVDPGEELGEVYHALSRSLNSAETDLATIKQALSEQEVGNDAFYCDFEVFRNLYRLEARAAARAGQAVFVGLLSLMGQNGPPQPGEGLNRSMAVLLDTIHQCLRRGDVVSRFSASQYILMLPTITVENAEMVMARVHERYKKAAPDADIHLQGRIQPLDPVL